MLQKMLYNYSEAVLNVSLNFEETFTNLLHVNKIFGGNLQLQMFLVFIESVCAVETHQGHSLKWKVRYSFERVLGHGTVKQRYPGPTTVWHI